MPTGQPDLAILGAEQYDDGSSSSRGNARRPAASSSSDDVPAPRKRARRPPVASGDAGGGSTTATATEGDAGGGGGGGGEKKRARGRPRLTADDESAAERRRTQIRLAQRAYRNRKETAITTLEQQVKDLRDTNEEMSHAFMALHDFAVQRGLLDTRPDFGDRLRSTTERFVALARKTAEVGAVEDEADAPEPAGADNAGRKTKARAGTPSSEEVEEVPRATDRPSVGASALPQQQQQPQQMLYGGFVVSQEYVPNLDASMPNYGFGDAVLGGNLDLDVGIGGSAWNELETITQPTMDNASFPLTEDQIFSIMGGGTTAAAPSPLPHPALPSPPRTYAASESTFGRRLQRFAVERALSLISMPNPPPLRLVRVFGFCLPFESADDIRRRLSSALSRPQGQSMFYWQYPFHHLGGAGSHFPPGTVSSTPTDPARFGAAPTVDTRTQQQQQQQQRSFAVGNQGTADVMRPRNGAGFGMGPFTQPVSESGSSHLDARQRIKVPGFEGDFYDSDEVELWLRRRGVDIAPAQDYVTTEVDLSAFDQPGSPGEGNASSLYPAAPEGLFPTQDIMGYKALDSGAAGGVGDFGSLGTASATALPTTAAPTGPHLPPPPSSAHERSPPNMWSTGSENLLADMSTFMFSGVSFDSQDMFAAPSASAGDFTARNNMQFMPDLSMPQQAQQPATPRKTLITLDVSIFVQKLTEKATCLGRSPGFRIDNVRQAFLASAHRLSMTV
ncbi:hypothetical protein RB600_009131 [Gaeumannomyces tritici]